MLSTSAVWSKQSVVPGNVCCLQMGSDTSDVTEMCRESMVQLPKSRYLVT
jgi:hypothetical protein